MMMPEGLIHFPLELLDQISFTFTVILTDDSNDK